MSNSIEIKAEVVGAGEHRVGHPEISLKVARPTDEGMAPTEFLRVRVPCTAAQAAEAGQLIGSKVTITIEG
jgi:hypothetical protein